ncbi:hypothetical protein B481_2013 [Planococcus halocryophilus Or1]|uniref:Uncharacterized protein n=1 Tax=Planococcus halocryophilus TaxID=1215089 RepID=A0A1C7DQE2_9BACL|nr:hypothetical protein [Planococcus halocryophilus]ANU13481.1 hypothetical protein BBI08_06325 [Planococcus halocryophilus]EMF46286.1 hypothetical protein B481_2013 [Planococcus halocryophilus Or1]
MKEVTNAKDFIIGALILITFSLSLALINADINLFPNWLLRSFVTGLFTIIGVALGANFAAKNALKVISINKSNEDEKLKELHIRNQKIIIEHGDELISYLDDHNRALDALFDEKKASELPGNLHYLNAISYNIRVLLEELLSIDSVDLHDNHDYYFRKLRKTCKILKFNPFLSSALKKDFKADYIENENMLHHNNISIGLEQIKIMVRQIRAISI